MVRIFTQRERERFSFPSSLHTQGGKTEGKQKQYNNKKYKKHTLICAFCSRHIMYFSTNDRPLV